MFYEDLLNFVLAWGRSRRWRRTFLIALLPGLLMSAAVGIIVYGATFTRQQLAVRYFDLVRLDIEADMQAIEDQPGPKSAEAPPAEAEAAESAAGDESPSSENESSLAASSAQRVLIPLRRMLQLGNASERVVYLVGRALAQQGRLAMGASMMRDIAPARGGGFPPAHAWLAEYSMASWKGTQTQAEQLLADLGTAEKGGARLSAQQLAFYASLLDNKGRKQEAMQLLRNYTASYPELNLLILQLEKQEGVVGSDSRDALAAGRAEFERKQKSGSVTFEDIAQAVQLEMYAEEIDRALQLANAGFKQEPENLAARRLFSSMLIVKHQAVLEQWRIEVDRAQALRKAAPGIELRYLELACEIDSANPVITEELAKVMTMGQNLSPEMHKMLESSLIDGTASGVTHLILANHKLQSTEPHLALPELRLALRKMPDAAIVMNNLAYGILKFDPKNLPEAKLLIEKALSIPGSTTSQRASMLDTLAEIRMEMGDILGAIELYEEAIEHDSTKISSRQKLADAYLKAGMKDLSQAQLRKVQELNEASSNAAESN